MTSGPKIKSFRDLQKEIPDFMDSMSLFAKLQSADDYSATIISASLLETSLETLLLTHFIPMGKEHQDDIFSDGGNGPLSSFSAKIRICYAMGLISSTTRSQIEIVKNIRNHFAHHKNIVSFDFPEVQEECKKLRVPKYLIEYSDEMKVHITHTSKNKYIHSCCNIYIEIHRYIKYDKAERITFPSLDIF